MYLFNYDIYFLNLHTIFDIRWYWILWIKLGDDFAGMNMCPCAHAWRHSLSVHSVIEELFIKYLQKDVAMTITATGLSTSDSGAYRNLYTGKRQRKGKTGGKEMGREALRLIQAHISSESTSLAGGQKCPWNVPIYVIVPPAHLSSLHKYLMLPQTRVALMFY